MQSLTQRGEHLLLLWATTGMQAALLLLYDHQAVPSHFRSACSHLNSSIKSNFISFWFYRACFACSPVSPPAEVDALIAEHQSQCRIFS